MSNTNKKFSLNHYLVNTMKIFGKKKSKDMWTHILKMRKSPRGSSWQDDCNGKIVHEIKDGEGTIKIVYNHEIYEFLINEQWCLPVD